MRLVILVIFLIGYVPTAYSETAVPETKIEHAWVQGVYWNPDLLPGWGFFVDVQEKTFFGAIYGYDGNDSTFITMQGTMTRLDPLRFQGDVYFVTQGGGAITDVGNFTWEAAYYEATPAAKLSITSNILNRSNLTLVRLVYKEIDKVDILTGTQWTTAEEIGTWYSESYEITDERISSEGKTYAVVDDMHPLDYGPGLVGYFPPGEGEMYALMVPYDDTTSSFYAFLATDSGMYGRYWMLDEGETPEGNGYFFRGTALAMQEANDSSGIGAILSRSGADPEWSEVSSQLALSRADGGSLKALEVEQTEQMANPLFAPEDISSVFEKLSSAYEQKVKISRDLD